MDILGFGETSHLGSRKAAAEGINDAQRLAIKAALKGPLLSLSNRIRPKWGSGRS